VIADPGHSSDLVLSDFVISDWQQYSTPSIQIFALAASSDASTNGSIYFLSVLAHFLVLELRL
jgi:hypothetical protein